MLVGYRLLAQIRAQPLDPRISAKSYASAKTMTIVSSAPSEVLEKPGRTYAGMATLDTRYNACSLVPRHLHSCSPDPLGTSMLTHSAQQPLPTHFSYSEQREQGSARHCLSPAKRKACDEGAANMPALHSSQLTRRQSYLYITVH